MDDVKTKADKRDKEPVQDEHEDTADLTEEDKDQNSSTGFKLSEAQKRLQEDAINSIGIETSSQQ